MQEVNNRTSIRRLLKIFGIGADEAIGAFLAQNPDIDVMRVRLTLEDITPYGDNKPGEPLRLVVEDDLERG